jgi:hypothetical protein
VREHLRACASCRATMRSYRAAPRIAAALAPLLPPSRSLLGRLHEAAVNAVSRLPGLGGDPAAVQVAAAGGSRGAGAAALAKLLALCAGAAGGAACVATGVVPVPTLTPDQQQKPAIERVNRSVLDATATDAIEYAPAPAEPTPDTPKQQHKAPPPESEGKESPEAPEATAGAIEYEPPPPSPAPAPTGSGESGGSSPSSGSAAGEFGP